MRRILYPALLAFLVLPSSAQSKAPRYSVLFCPEEWVYLVGDGATDLKGNCSACGKLPIDLEVRNRMWFWCGTLKVWLEKPCAENAARHCDVPEESIALVAGPGPNLLPAWYCPEHRSFNGVRLPLLDLMVCAENGKPMVQAWTARRAWYWCAMEGVWAAVPCPMHPLKGCCEKREGLLLSAPEPGPLAGQR